MIARDEFLEYAQVFGKYYGTAKSVLRHAEEWAMTYSWILTCRASDR